MLVMTHQSFSSNIGGLLSKDFHNSNQHDFLLAGVNEK